MSAFDVWTAPGSPADPVAEAARANSPSLDDRLADLAARLPVDIVTSAEPDVAVDPEPVVELDVAADPEPTTEPTPEPTPAEAPSPAPAPARPGSRAARRAARRAAAEAERRRTLRSMGLIAVPVIVILLVVAALGAFVINRGGGTPSAAPDGRGQQTLLLQVVGDGGLATGSVLLARSTTSDTLTGVLVPGNLLTQAPGAGTLTFDETARLPEPATAGAALSDQIDVFVDGTARLDVAALAGLIDALGGVQVSVDTDVVDDDGRVWLSAGPAKLAGSDAVRYATFATKSEPEQARSARLADVLVALFGVMPTDANQVAALLGPVGNGLESTWGTDDIGEFLASAGRAASAEDFGVTALPVKAIDTGAESATYRLDTQAAAELVTQRFPGALRAEGGVGSLRVLVENGAGTPGLGEVARTKLVDAGMTFISGGNASSFGREATAVVISDATPQSRAQGQAVAKALGLPETAVKTTNQGQNVADVLVVLGQDFVTDDGA